MKQTFEKTIATEKNNFLNQRFYWTKDFTEPTILLNKGFYWTNDFSEKTNEIYRKWTMILKPTKMGCSLKRWMTEMKKGQAIPSLCELDVTLVSNISFYCYSCILILLHVLNCNYLLGSTVEFLVQVSLFYQIKQTWTFTISPESKLLCLNVGIKHWSPYLTEIYRIDSKFNTLIPYGGLAVNEEIKHLSEVQKCQYWILRSW